MEPHTNFQRFSERLVHRPTVGTYLIKEINFNFNVNYCAILSVCFVCMHTQAADAAENTGSEAIQSLQAEKKQLTQKYQSLKQKLDQSNKGYQGLEEKSKTMEQDNKELLIQLNAERAKVREVKQRSRHVDDLENLLQEKQREIVQLAQERDSARTKIVEIQKQGSSSTSAENDAKAVQDYQNMKLQHDSVAIQLKQKERELQAKEVDAADLREQVNNLEKQLHSITERNIQKQHSYGTAHSKQSEVLQGQPLITVPPEKMTVMLAQKEQTISSLQEQVKQLQEQLSSLQSSSNPEVGSPTMEHVSGEVSYCCIRDVCTFVKSKLSIIHVTCVCMYIN